MQDLLLQRYNELFMQVFGKEVKSLSEIGSMYLSEDIQKPDATKMQVLKAKVIINKYMADGDCNAQVFGSYIKKYYDYQVNMMVRKDPSLHDDLVAVSCEIYGMADESWPHAKELPMNLYYYDHDCHIYTERAFTMRGFPKEYARKITLLVVYPVAAYQRRLREIETRMVFERAHKVKTSINKERPMSIYGINPIVDSMLDQRSELFKQLNLTPERQIHIFDEAKVLTHMVNRLHIRFDVSKDKYIMQCIAKMVNLMTKNHFIILRHPSEDPYSFLLMLKDPNLACLQLDVDTMIAVSFIIKRYNDITLSDKIHDPNSRPRVFRMRHEGYDSSIYLR